LARFTEIPFGAIPVMLTPFDDNGAVNYDVIDEMVDFYINAGVSAIFTVCLSSEMFHLTPEERRLIATRVVQRANGAIPILASGNFEGSLGDQVISIKSMYDTGVDAIVVLLSILPSPNDIPEQLMRLSDLSGVPLGIYECPSPKHIQITPEEIAQIAPSGRFIFAKETSSKLNSCINKVQAAANTPLRIFVANLSCTPKTLKAGGAGHCGIIANVCPELCAAMCNNSDAILQNQAYESAQLMHDIMCACDYLPAAKYILNQRGLAMGHICRSTSNILNDTAKTLLDDALSIFRFCIPLPADSILKLRTRLDQTYPGK